MKGKILFIVCFVIFAAFGFAQVKTDTASEEFERGGFGESTPQPTKKPPTPIKTSGGKKPIPTATPIRSVGKFGMKILLERQIACNKEKQFFLVPPTTVFSTGDCIRLKFQLNFLGYLTIANLGTSGKTKVLFPEENQSNEISPKTPTYFPKDNKWEFIGEPGNEQLVFIVSKSPLKKKEISDSVGNREITEKSPDIEIYDRDIVPRTEKDEVYVLDDGTKLDKPLVFRMTIKHREKK